MKFARAKLERGAVSNMQRYRSERIDEHIRVNGFGAGKRPPFGGGIVRVPADFGNQSFGCISR